MQTFTQAFKIIFVGVAVCVYVYNAQNILIYKEREFNKYDTQYFICIVFVVLW